MTRPPWSVRVAQSNDERRLRRLKCAPPGNAPWHVEVEAYVQQDLLRWSATGINTKYDPRVLLLFHRSTLIGVAAHERNVLGAGKITFLARKVHVLALSTKWHGKQFSNGERVSDVLVTAVLADVAKRDGPETHVFAVVHRENGAALRLLARHGFEREMTRTHPDYRWLLRD